MQRRLDFARAHLHWTVADWSRVIWTDKSSFELGKPVTQRRIWWSTNQKYDLESMASELILMPPGQRQAVDFIENFYEPGLLPFMDESVKVGVAEDRKELTLMEDSALIHTAIASQQWREENRIRKLVWPAYSPDLNPIRNLWFKMKYVVTNLFNPKRMDELTFAVNAVWETLPFDHVEALLLSLPARMQMVVDQNGAPTRW
ncbi:hypothetical protein O181_034159 [Austropuccinia psidii MF-1]|uniref:Tc1-like transposase DDE domain-containing protein n=1 Tax=Austropuccinia psidii MF-1 TaxID=1389203 RepID=A0A9Q3D057_9BASI|nr:hypothetical protein [Austropuccinia psidii MF-1]